MAIELARHLEESLALLSPNDPDRKLLQRVSKETAEHLNVMRLAGRLRNAFGLLPDDTRIHNVIPEYFRVSVLDGRVRRGRYQGMAKDEVLALYPAWQQIYSGEETREKAYLTNLTSLISRRVRTTGINTLGDIRNASYEIEANGIAESRSILLLRTGFTPPSDNLDAR